MTLKSPEAESGNWSGQDIEVRLSQCEEGLDWHRLFGNHNPVEMEIGCGKGRFIIKSARQNPAVNYFGIERAGTYYRILKERALKAGVDNIRLHNGEADYFVRKYVPRPSVQAYHIFFPDPWPKKRHHKRRLVQASFVEAARETLVAGGCIYYATDFEDYFQQMVAVSRACPGLEEASCRVIRPEEADPEEAATNYERKYLLQGRTIYKAAYKKP